MQITVTQDLIDKSSARDAEHCPIANAVRAACRQTFNLHPDEVQVYATDIKLRWNRFTSKQQYFENADALVSFVRQYDGDEPDAGAVRPFSFDLPVLAPTTEDR